MKKFRTVVLPGMLLLIMITMSCEKRNTDLLMLNVGIIQTRKDYKDNLATETSIMVMTQVLTVGEPIPIFMQVRGGDEDTSISITGFPEIKWGMWKNGRMELEGPGAQFRMNAALDIIFGKLPQTVEPDTSFSTAFDLAEFADLRKEGDYRLKIEIPATTLDGAQRMLQAETTFTLLPRDMQKYARQSTWLKGAANAISSYYVDWSRLPSMRIEDRIPFFGHDITTPIAYLSGEHLHKMKGAAYFSDPQYGCYFLVAYPGPDNIWDIQEMFDSPRIFTGEEILSLAYDPTNGAMSAGDLMRLCEGPAAQIKGAGGVKDK
ncbi:MAG TPA: hypothetical protein PLB62_04620 [Candidatus Sumerlaeota bacterium]|nr:hypothetical protein [Candidatus Sumerlaeota bacterium]